MNSSSTSRRILVPPVVLLAAVLASPGWADEPAQPEPTPVAAAPASRAPADTSPQVTQAIVNAPVGEVWKVFSTPEGFKALGVVQCDMDFRPGGLIRTAYSKDVVLGDPRTIQNRILAYEPERMLAFRIDRPPAGFPFMNAYKDAWSVCTLTDLGDNRTEVRLAMIGFTPDEESQKMRAFFRDGNAWVMKKLQQHFDASVKIDQTKAAHAPDPLAPIEAEVVVDAPREDVFNAYTTSAGWKSVMGVESKIELRPGGPFEIYFSMEPPAGQRGSEGCTVLSFIPTQMFSYTWNAPPRFPEARSERTWVVLTFDELAPSRTRVHMTQLGFAERAAADPAHADEYKQVRAYFAEKWPMVLGALKQHWAKEPAKSEAAK